MKNSKQFTDDDIAIIKDMLGFYSARSIAEHIGTTETVIGKWCKRNAQSLLDVRYANGIPQMQLAKHWRLNHNLIRVWIEKHSMPVIKPPAGYGDNYFNIIDNAALPAWLEKGYALSQAIRPITPEYITMLKQARERIYSRMIPTKAISDIIFINMETVYRYIRIGKMIKPNFTYAYKMYHNRISLALYLRQHYGTTVANRVFDVKWSI